MSTIENMPDWELSELLATNVMKLVLDGAVWRDEAGNYVRDAVGDDTWNPCQDYNHLRQVEERLTTEQRISYGLSRYRMVLDGSSLEGIKFTFVDDNQLTARQRCECIARVIAQ